MATAELMSFYQQLSANSAALNTATQSHSSLFAETFDVMKNPTLTGLFVHSTDEETDGH
jgi:hypothetical protein